MSQKVTRKAFENDHHKEMIGQALTAHTYNLSYAGDRDQEDCGSKPAWLAKPYLRKTLHNNRAGGGSR
jgi:hypothetical protein